MLQTIALFGESEKGAYQTPHVLTQMPQLLDVLGNPPEESLGLFFAIQTILFNRELIFIRVPEEGYSRADYMYGLKMLKEYPKPLSALCLPGVGDPEILGETKKLRHNPLLITNQKDLYDYLTSQY